MGRGDYLGEFEQIVLLAVARLGEEGYGTTIRREIERRTGRQVSVGALYATLERLERKDFLSTWESEPTARRGGRAKRHFRLAPSGVRALEEAREMLESLWGAGDE
jgi:DNA-binding PadR family transcriptional regulator